VSAPMKTARELAVDCHRGYTEPWDEWVTRCERLILASLTEMREACAREAGSCRAGYAAAARIRAMEVK
jgi:hypothetical protein